MTDHRNLIMNHEDRRITNPEIIKKILAQNIVCTLCIPDEPYPYVVPMNYGCIWEDSLVLYMHMADQGHRMELLQRTNAVTCNVHAFLDRYKGERYRGEGHDYRSVTIYGRAEVISPEQPEEFLKGMNTLSRHCGHAELKNAPGNGNLRVLKVTAEIITAKAQYPLRRVEDAEMPPLQASIRNCK